MRDLMGDARRHRARFVLTRPAVPPVGRILLAARGVTMLRYGHRTTLTVTANPTFVQTRSFSQLPLGAPAPVPAVPLSSAEGGRVSAAVLRLTRRLDTLSATHRLERVVSTVERRVIRTEERVPQVTRVLTYAGITDQARQGAESRPDAERGAPASRPQFAVAPPQPASLDLARITDHVLGAMDERLSAYAERLGRG